MTNLIFLLMAVISGPSILALFCECFGVFKSWRAAIHDKAFDSFRSLYDGDGNYEWIDKELELGTSYTKYKGMGSSYTYSGLPAFLYPDGITLRGIRIFEKGAFEDFLCYVMNEEEFLSIFLADDRNPFTRLMRRSHFPAVHGIMLFLYSYAAVAMAEGDSSSYYSITYFLIVPGQWILSLILKRALAWNCCYSCRGGCCSKYVWHYLVRAPVFYMAVLQIGSIAIYTQTFASAGLSYQVALYYVFNYFCIVMIVSTLLSLCRIFVCFSADPFIDKLGACCGAIRHAFPWTWATMHNQVVETEKASGRAVTNEKVEELA